MVRYYPSLDENHIKFITAQPLFFVASAPWAGDHINVSPKGHLSRTFCVLGPNTVAYLDATGSGCETISHIYENGRVTLMFCSFGPSPQIMRLFCKGRVVEKFDHHYQELRAKMATENGDDVDIIGARAIIVLKIQKVQTSCGFGVPMTGKGATSSSEDAGDAVTMVEHNDETAAGEDWKPRETMEVWARKMLEKQELMDYQKRSNHQSLDGLPGMLSARRALDQNFVLEDTKAWFRKVSRQGDAVLLGVGLGFLLMILLSVVGIVSIRPTFIHRFLNYQRRQMGVPEEPWDKSEL